MPFLHNEYNTFRTDPHVTLANLGGSVLRYFMEIYKNKLMDYYSIARKQILNKKATLKVFKLKFNGTYRSITIEIAPLFLAIVSGYNSGCFLSW